jgi:hypothetical protein
MKSIFVLLLYCLLTHSHTSQIFSIKIRDSKIYLVSNENIILDSIKLRYSNDFGYVNNNSLFVLHSNFSNSYKPRKSYEFTEYKYKRGVFKKKTLSRFTISTESIMCEDKESGFTINNFRIYQKDGELIWEFGYGIGQKKFKSIISNKQFKKKSKEICKELKKLEIYDSCMYCKSKK